MAKLRIELENENEEIILVKKEKVKGRAVRKAFQVMRKMQETEFEDEKLDLMIDYVVDTFNNPKVTEDTILDGIESEKLMETLTNIVSTVIGSDAADNDPNAKK